MRLSTVAIWGGISLVAILAVGYTDPEWMFRTAALAAVLWTAFYALANKKETATNEKKRSENEEEVSSKQS